MKKDFDGCIAELTAWFELATEAQKEILITSIRDMSDVINDEMPIIEE